MPTAPAQITIDRYELHRELNRELRRVVAYLDLQPDDRMAAAWVIEALREHFHLGGMTVWPDAAEAECLGQLVDLAAQITSGTEHPDEVPRWVVQRLAVRLGLDLVVDHAGDAHLVEDAARHTAAAAGLLDRFARLTERDAPF